MAEVAQCGPGLPFSPNYADSFEQAWYDPASDSLYAAYEQPGVTVRYPLSTVQSSAGEAGSDAFAMATARDEQGVFMPGVLSAHTTPRLAKLAGDARQWKEDWANADAMTRASMELLPIVTAYGGQGNVAKPSNISSTAATKTIEQGTTPLARSGPIAASVGAMSHAEQLARKFRLNLDSATTRQILNSLDDKVSDFVGSFRQGRILRELPQEVQNMTVEEALGHSSKVRKLLTDGRFVK